MENILYEELVDNIITNLKILSLVNKDDKLCIRKGHLQIDKTSYFRFIKRYYYSDSRYSTIEFLKKIVNNMKGIKELKQIISEDSLHKIEIGINNLQVSYSNDPVMIATLDNLLNKLKNNII
jgi:Flp pilus assembly CpaF family ATPase